MLGNETRLGRNSYSGDGSTEWWLMIDPVSSSERRGVAVAVASGISASYASHASRQSVLVLQNRCHRWEPIQLAWEERGTGEERAIIRGMLGRFACCLHAPQWLLLSSTFDLHSPTPFHRRQVPSSPEKWDNGKRKKEKGLNSALNIFATLLGTGQQHSLESFPEKRKLWRRSALWGGGRASIDVCFLIFFNYLSSRLLPVACCPLFIIEYIEENRCPYPMYIP